MSVLLFAEQRDGTPSSLSLQAWQAGQEIAQFLQAPLEVVVMGRGAAEAASALARYGADKVYVVEHPQLEQYTADGFTLALEQILQQKQPQVTLFPHSYLVRDFVPKLAARLRLRFISDAVGARPEAQSIIYTRQLFQGKLNADIRADGQSPVLVSIQAGTYQVAQPAEAPTPIEILAVTLKPEDIRSKAEEPFRPSQRLVDLSRSEIVVSAGRGIQKEENLAMMQQLADALGAELGASRPICDQGWLPLERQVGSSGQTVSPKAYFAVGISGAIQHTVGMKGARTIVAINKDENAPIFEIADYGIVGDLFDVVPALIEEVKRVKG
jgi:electron transfer flavoprotein alpha subunit